MEGREHGREGGWERGREVERAGGKEEKRRDNHKDIRLAWACGRAVDWGTWRSDRVNLSSGDFLKEDQS